MKNRHLDQVGGAGFNIFTLKNGVLICGLSSCWQVFLVCKKCQCTIFIIDVLVNVNGFLSHLKSENTKFV